MNKEWIEINSASDVETDSEVLLWDGEDYFIDYVEYCADYGTHHFANSTEGATHYKLLISPLGESK